MIIKILYILKKCKSDGSSLKVKLVKEDGNIMGGSKNSSLALVLWSSGHSFPKGTKVDDDPFESSKKFKNENAGLQLQPRVQKGD
jgi:hypothetical protein